MTRFKLNNNKNVFFYIKLTKKLKKCQAKQWNKMRPSPFKKTCHFHWIRYRTLICIVYDSRRLFVRPLLIHLLISSFQHWILTRLKREKNQIMTSTEENEGIVGIRRKSSGIAALMTTASMTLNCNMPNIPIINEPIAAACPSTTADVKKKALRFDTNTHCNEYDTEEVRENKRKITDEIKQWV